MDRVAAFAVTAAVPLLAMVFYVFTTIMPPFWGYGAALAVYWVCVLVPLIIWRGGLRRARFALIFPHRAVTALNAIMILGVTGAAGFALMDNLLPIWVFGAVALAAFANGTLEEVFWRGTLLQDDASTAEQLVQLGLFTGWHIALLFATGVVVTGGALALLGGAAFGGALWTLARMQTGSIGFCIAGHVGLNLVAFTELAAHNVS